MIYFDNAATSPILPEVIDAMLPVLKENYGNPSSTHTIGHQAAKLLRESREKIAGILEVPANSLTFTSGASEANSSALIGYALAHASEGKHIVTTSIEHPSVMEALNYLKERYGFNVTFVRPDFKGKFSTQEILKAVRSDTILLSTMLVNNETGQILPVAEIGEALEELLKEQNRPIAFHVDATQALGKIPVRPLTLHADFLSASAHKFHGPKGIGLLYTSPTVKYDPLIHGGEQENKRRAGTENIPSIIGMAKALEMEHISLDKNFNLVYQLRKQLLAGLAQNNINFYENRFGETLPHVISLGFPKINHDLLLTQLDLAGIAVSTGSACTAGTNVPSYVLQSVYGSDSPKLKENIRLSLSELNTENEINEFLKILKGLIH